MTQLRVNSDRFNGRNTSLKQRAANQMAKATGTGRLEGTADFLIEKQKSKTIQITLDNTTGTADKRIALFSGMLTSVAELATFAGISVDGIAQAGQSVDTCAVSGKYLPVMQKWVLYNPMRISRINLAVNNKSQFYKEFEIAVFGVNQNYGTETIRPADQLSPNQQQDTIVELLPKHFQLDSQTVLALTVGKGMSIEITLEVETEINNAQALREISTKLIGE